MLVISLASIAIPCYKTINIELNYVISGHMYQVKQKKQFASENVVMLKRCIHFIPAFYSLLVILHCKHLFCARANWPKQIKILDRDTTNKQSK